MPVGNVPPAGILRSSVFSALAGMNYDATAKAFKDGANNTIYMYVEKQSSTSDLPQWNYGTAAEAATHNNPRGAVSQAVANIILGGSYNTDGTVTYGVTSYRFRLERDANGVDQVVAV